MAYPGGFGQYMRAKRLKLAEQSLVASTQIGALHPTLFAGLTLHLNGYSSMTMTDFRETCVAHGAQYREIYGSSVTHVLASQVMTDSKMIKLRVPVVKPEWIHDSISAGKLLDWRLYRLFSTDSPKQTRLAVSISQPVELQEAENSEDGLEHDFENDMNKEDDEDLEKNETKDDESKDTYKVDHSDKMNTPFIQSLVSTSPGFIKNFFSSSRLHHLSNWKAELSHFVSKEMEAKQTSSQQRFMHSNIKDPLRVIMHIDMDCYFASIGIRDRPHLKDVPVGISHSTGTSTDSSSAEIASCNYIARSLGLHNGMFLGSALKLVPDLVLLPYEFEKYDAASRALYHTLVGYADFVQAVSCDEAYIDVTFKIKNRIGSSTDPEELEMAAKDLAETIRADVVTVTGCIASVGISSNLLLARMATKKAKPDGVHFVHQSDASHVLEQVPISDLPGVGCVLTKKCQESQLVNCGQLIPKSLDELQKSFGTKTGEMLYHYARGIDDRILQNKARQSIGAEVNWAMRFETHVQIDTFLGEFCQEVFERMTRWNVVAKHVTVTAKKKKYQGEPPKFLGHGSCDDFSKSLALGKPICTHSTLFEVVLTLFKELNLVPTDVRGIGIHLKKLSPGPSQELKRNTLGFSVIDHNPLLVQETRDFHSPVKSPTPSKISRVPSNFFSPRTMKKATAIKEKYGLELSSIDPDVFNELPFDIQEELKNAGFDPTQSPIKRPQFSDSLTPGDWIPSASQIDPDILDALPEDIRNEQLEAIHARQQLKRKQEEENPFLVDDEPLEPLEPLDTIRDLVVPRLGTITDQTVIISVLMDWVNNQRDQPPADEAVHELSECLVTAAMNFQLEFAVSVLKMLMIKLGMNTAKGKVRQDWADVMFRLFETIDEIVFKEYGSRLRRWFV